MYALYKVSHTHLFQVLVEDALEYLQLLKEKGCENIDESVEEGAGHEVTQLQCQSLAYFLGNPELDHGVWPAFQNRR